MNKGKKLLPLVHSGLFRGLGAVSQLVLAWWVSQNLPKDESGYFLFYIACFTLTSPLVLFGTQQFAMRHLSQYARIDAGVCRDAHSLFRFGFKTAAVIACVVLPLAFLADQLPRVSRAEVSLQGNVRWLAVASLLASGCLTVAAHFHGVRHLASSLFFSHICIPSVAVVLFASVSVGDADAAIRLHCLACLVSLALALGAWGRTFSLFQFWGRTEERLGNLRACFDLWLLNAFVLTVNWSPLIIAGLWVSAGEIAELNIAQRAANLINFLLIVVSFAFAPQFRFAWAQKDLHALRNKVSRCSLYLMAIGTPVAIGTMLGAPLIMGAFGEEYASGALVLCIFAAGQYFNVITGSVNQILTMCDHERVLRNICMVSSASALILGLLLVPWWGAIGAATAVAGALVLQNVLAVLAVKRLLGFWVFDPRQVAPVDLTTRPKHERVVF